MTPPRDGRAVQHHAYPARPPNVLRETEPGRQEAGADIGLDSWTRFKTLFEGYRFTVRAGGVNILTGMG
jgi:hypothetical protein